MELWKTCRAINNEIRLAMLREIARSPNRELNVLQAGDFVGLKKAAASQYLKQLADAGFLMVERTGKFVVCFGKPQDGTAASRIAKALVEAFPAKARPGWQASLLTAINAFAHHVRLRIVRAVAAAGHVGFEEFEGTGPEANFIFAANPPHYAKISAAECRSHEEVRVSVMKQSVTRGGSWWSKSGGVSVEDWREVSDTNAANLR